MADDKKKAAPAKPVKKEKVTKPYKAAKKHCPKCGTGTRLADHKDRSSCGKCGYFEKK